MSGIAAGLRACANYVFSSEIAEVLEIVAEDVHNEEQMLRAITDRYREEVRQLKHELKEAQS